MTPVDENAYLFYLNCHHPVAPFFLMNTFQHRIEVFTNIMLEMWIDNDNLLSFEYENNRQIRAGWFKQSPETLLVNSCANP